MAAIGECALSCRTKIDFFHEWYYICSVLLVGRVF